MGRPWQTLALGTSQLLRRVIVADERYLRYSSTLLYKSAPIRRNRNEVLWAVRHVRRLPRQQGHESWAALAIFESKQDHREKQRYDSYFNVLVVGAVAFLGGLPLLSSSSHSAACEASTKPRHPTPQQLTPAQVAKEDLDEVIESHENVDTMPVYTAEEVAENNGEDGRPVWMTYGGIVYNVTDFVQNHPGGAQHIMMAAGGAIEPFWHLYRQHFASDLPMRLMEHMVIGRLAESDQNVVDEELAQLQEQSEDPYAHEPLRHRALLVHSDTPMNAEVPGKLLTKSYYTPNSLFYIRHHHPVPYMTEEDIHNYRLTLDLTAIGQGVVEFSLDDLKAMDKVEITATLQCSGNRRSGFNMFDRTSGTPWGQGAISTASFGGVRLTDILKKAGVEDLVTTAEKSGMEHVRFHGMDGMMASVHIQKALNPYGDCVVCYEMNGESLPRDHGFPLRILVPGYAAVRSVKWLEKIELAATEAEGAWQRGLNYKVLPPSVTDASSVSLEKMPSLTEVSVFSGITRVEKASISDRIQPGERITMKVQGWAWAGGGRNIVRVDCTGDNGKSWATATLKEGSEQKFGRAWAWVFWECDVPAVVLEDGTVRLASKAVDMALNVQPESCEHSWNVRGLGNNSWYRAQARVV